MSEVLEQPTTGRPVEFRTTPQEVSSEHLILTIRERMATASHHDIELPLTESIASLTGIQRGRILSFLDSPVHIDVLASVLSDISEGSSISVEGTPLYAGQNWDIDHEFGYNTLLSSLHGLLTGRGCDISHQGLFDEYTTGQDEDQLGQRSILPFDSYEGESQMGDEASSAVRLFEQYGVLGGEPGDRVLIGRGSQPAVESGGRFSCAMMDSVFQNRKESEHVILVHPDSYMRQQDYMRRVLVQMVWIRQLENLREQLERVIHSHVIPDIPEDQRHRVEEKIECMFGLLQGQATTFNRIEVVNQIRPLFGSKFHKKQEAGGRFQGLNAAWTNILVGFLEEDLLPFDMTVIFFSEDHRLTYITRMDRSGTVQSEPISHR